MSELFFNFIKVFFRNVRAMFFVIFLPVGIILAVALLHLENVVRYDNQIVPYSQFLVTGVLAFAVMQTGVYTVTYTLIDYRRGFVLKRLSVTPLTARDFLISQTNARFIIALVQAAILLAIGWVLYGLHYQVLVVAVPAAVFVGNIIFLSMGFVLSSFANDYEQAAPYTTIAGSILLFLGDVFFPVKNLPRFLEVAASYLPMKPIIDFIRYFTFGINSGNFIRDAVVIAVWLVGLLAVAIFLFRRVAYK